MYESASNGKLQMEVGGTYYAYESMTKQTDDTKDYEVTAGRLFSRSEDTNGVDMTYDIAMDGVLSGCELKIAAAGTADIIDVRPGTVQIAGVEVTCAGATSLAVARGGSACIKYSILCSNAGVVTALAGTTHASLSDTRAATGGPPLVTVGYVELGQVWYSSLTPAVVAVTELHMNPEQHTELAYYPGWKYVKPTGSDDQKIELTAALMLNHTGPASRLLYAQYYNPVFATLSQISDMKPPRTSYSGTEQKTYDGTEKVTDNESLSDGSFKILLTHEANQLIKKAHGQVRWFKWFPNKTKTDYQLFCGRVVLVDEYPQGGFMMGTVSIITEIPVVDKQS